MAAAGQDGSPRIPSASEGGEHLASFGVQEFANAAASLPTKTQWVALHRDQLDTALVGNIHFFRPDAEERAQRPGPSIGECQIMLVNHSGRRGAK